MAPAADWGKPRLYGQPIVGAEGACGSCANCQSNARDAANIARLNQEGFGGELLGSLKPCIRQQEAARRLTEVSAG